MVPKRAGHREDRIRWTGYGPAQAAAGNARDRKRLIEMRLCHDWIDQS